jgi:hypothetical protein
MHEHKDGDRVYYLHPLHYRVLCVAVVNVKEKEWAAYVKDVPGEHHDDEWQDVAAIGNKLDQKIAEVIWPQFKKYEWRK